MKTHVEWEGKLFPLCVTRARIYTSGAPHVSSRFQSRVCPSVNFKRLFYISIKDSKNIDNWCVWANKFQSGKQRNSFLYMLLSLYSLNIPYGHTYGNRMSKHLFKRSTVILRDTITIMVSPVPVSNTSISLCRWCIKSTIFTIYGSNKFLSFQQTERITPSKKCPQSDCCLF